MRLRLKLELNNTSNSPSLQDIHRDVSKQIEDTIRSKLLRRFVSRTPWSETRKIQGTYCFDISENDTVSGTSFRTFRMTLSILPGYYNKSDIIETFMNFQFNIGEIQVKLKVVQIDEVNSPQIQRKMRYKCTTPIFLPVHILVNDKVEHQFVRPFEYEYKRKFIHTLIGKRFLLDKENFDINEWEEPEFRLVHQPEKVKFSHPGDSTELYAYKFSFEAVLPLELQQLGYYAGFGEMNHLGLGMVDVIDE